MNINAGGSNGFNVTQTASGDWLQYTVNIPTSGKYAVDTRYAAPANGATVHFTFDATVKTSSLVLPKTGLWTSYHTAESSAVNLTAGVHTLRVWIDHNVSNLTVGANLDWFDLTQIAGPSNLNWKAAAAGPVKAFEGDAALVNGKLYTFGGFTTISPFGVNDVYQVYDPSANAWTSLGAMPIPETHAGVAVDEKNGLIYFVGGFRGNYPGDATSDVFQLDTTTNTWSQLPSLPFAMAAGEAAFLDGKLHYFGGNHGTDRVTDFADHYVLDLSQLASGEATWQTAAPVPIGRDHASVAVANGKIYSLGGEIGHEVLHQQQLNTYAYDPATDSWATLAPMPIPRSHAEASTFLYNGMIVVAGGQVDDSQSTNTILMYDPSADRWSKLPASLPKALQGTVVQPWNNQLIVTAGYDGKSGVSSNQTWIGKWPTVVPAPPPPPPPSNYVPSGPFSVGQTIEAENYDLGGEGVAYHDTSPINAGRAAYRPGDGVDIQTGGSNGYSVSSALAGEWMNYTLNVDIAGSYTLQAAVANNTAGGSFHAEFGGIDLTGRMAVPKTPGWQTFQTVASPAFNLPAGKTVLRIFVDANAANNVAGNFDWFKLVPA